MHVHEGDIQLGVMEYAVVEVSSDEHRMRAEALLIYRARYMRLWSMHCKEGGNRSNTYNQSYNWRTTKESELEEGTCIEDLG